MSALCLLCVFVPERKAARNFPSALALFLNIQHLIRSRQISLTIVAMLQCYTQVPCPNLQTVNKYDT